MCFVLLLFFVVFCLSVLVGVMFLSVHSLNYDPERKVWLLSCMRYEESRKGCPAPWFQSKITRSGSLQGVAVVFVTSWCNRQNGRLEASSAGRL